MTQTWLCPDLVFDGQDLLAGQALGVADGVTTALLRATLLPADAKRQRISGTITPGFLDLQVNGGGDVLLNSDPTPAGMAAIAAAHRRFGTIGIMPTLITDAPDLLDHAAKAAFAARNRRHSDLAYGSRSVASSAKYRVFTKPPVYIHC